MTNLNAQSFQHKLQAKVPIEFLKADYKVSVDGIELLRKCIGAKPWLMKTAI